MGIEKRIFQRTRSLKQRRCPPIPPLRSLSTTTPKNTRVSWANSTSDRAAGETAHAPTRIRGESATTAVAGSLMRRTSGAAMTIIIVDSTRARDANATASRVVRIGARALRWQLYSYLKIVFIFRVCFNPSNWISFLELSNIIIYLAISKTRNFTFDFIKIMYLQSRFDEQKFITRNIFGESLIQKK